MNQATRRTLAASVLFATTGYANALTGEQEAACGAILCLAGGSGVAACVPYLTRYFSITHWNPERLFALRWDFLNRCPASDLPAGIRPLLARYGSLCQPDRLLYYLNGQLCNDHGADSGGACREPDGGAWRVCAPFFEHTVYKPPLLVERCSRSLDFDGGWARTCEYKWAPADYEVESGCGNTPRAGLGGCTETLVDSISQD